MLNVLRLINLCIHSSSSSSSSLELGQQLQGTTLEMVNGKEFRVRFGFIQGYTRITGGIF
jgi:hypothetical protein